MKKQKRPIIRVLIALGLAVSMVVQAIPPSPASAGQITDRSLTLIAGPTDGGSKPGGVVRHLLQFTLPTNANIGSIKFQYCTTAADTGGATCVVPTGLVTTAATLDSQTGINGWSLATAAPNGAPYLTRAATYAVPNNTAVAYQLGNVTNPTTTNQSFYVRITTYASLDATGSSIDAGTVVASTTTPIILTGIMPESLVFCTGATISTTSGVPDCATATGGAINFDRLFSATDTSIASSQMAASTNAGFGYAVTVNGTTLTSGSNTITPIATTSASIKGISQFGMNLKLNTTAASNPIVGGEVVPAANGTNYRGQAKTGYEVVDSFTYNSGAVVAASDNGTPGGTDAQIFTKSYIVNVPGSQPAGTYTTTLTYIATPTF